ncbi:alpha-mannosidase [Salegentibacter salinarum]|uniref:Alpha-mannosidase n=1 Tax=Salegentibacter salinarum TaxID=447422 RepID=A0A2N0U062_9FLAO|nr:glycoside hydrolase domain-containing protein [Salegentibacter salinarum]PKD20384.1 alpha-mannosidase [Salegentibacter salinarum]SKB85348.1 Putative alpha-1,2-mannosidase [Salegentibacter salinarum]
MSCKKSILSSLLFLAFTTIFSQQNFTEKVNVFLGTSGDYGQMSPAASYPFSMMSISPQTIPHNHTGYEYYAKKYIGFTHTRIEGVGCTGSGGNILIRPFSGNDYSKNLIKKSQTASPGNYSVFFENGIKAKINSGLNYGVNSFTFPKNKNGVYIDLGFALAGRFKAEEHQIKNGLIKGWIDTETTCSRGVYRLYFAIKLPSDYDLKKLTEHKYILSGDSDEIQIPVAFSSVNSEYAAEKIKNNQSLNLKETTEKKWNELLGRIQVEGENDREKLFYSLLYRGLQAPFQISENDGKFRATNGSIQTSKNTTYNGWAIWDNYREQLPMLSLMYPDKYADIVKSIANLYRFGKQEWATMHEPSPTVRTEHALVVLLDAVRKGYDLNLKSIKKSLMEEANNLKYDSPDKALETSYDKWAMAGLLHQINEKELSYKYLKESQKYKEFWKKDFKDLSRNDVDQMHARGLYQGTIWQYRWFVPFDLNGLKKLVGGEDKFLDQLDQFFEDYNYNHANQPDLQVPGIYNATKKPWKSQKLFRKILLDTMVQTYFNNNSKGIDSYIGKIYKNQPRAYLRTMDDDAGTMSSWFVMRSLGLSAANVGSPIYYLTAPIFREYTITYKNNKEFKVKVNNYNKDWFYIKSAKLNGKTLNRNWLTHQEIVNGGYLEIELSKEPNKKWGLQDQFATDLERPFSLPSK